jgi:uncharacterized protein (TIGR03067 family)
VSSATSKAASLFAVGQSVAAGVVSPTVAALAEGVLKAMFSNKIKAGMGVLLLAGLLGAGAAAALFCYQTQAAQSVVTRAGKKDEKPASRDRDRIQGTWRLVKAEVNGVELPVAFLQPREGSLAVFSGDKLSTNFLDVSEKDEGKGVHPTFTFKLDPARKPKTIDLRENAKKTLLGIYRLDGDDLELCICRGGKQERPAAFTNYWKAGSYSALLVLKRQPAPAKGKGKGKAAVKEESKLWAAISVNQPVFQEGDTGPGLFQINFTVVNDGDRTIDPECESSRLLINGKELKDWSFIVSNGPRDSRWKALPAKDHLVFGYALGKYFDKPGVYKVVWKGKKFQSPEIVFRVMPKKR